MNIKNLKLKILLIKYFNYFYCKIELHKVPLLKNQGHQFRHKNFQKNSISLKYLKNILKE